MAIRLNCGKFIGDHSGSFDIIFIHFESLSETTHHLTYTDDLTNGAR